MVAPWLLNKQPEHTKKIISLLLLIVSFFRFSQEKALGYKKNWMQYFY